jgi:hypothetical protein
MKILKLSYFAGFSEEFAALEALRKPTSWLVFLVLDEQVEPYHNTMKVILLACMGHYELEAIGRIMNYSKNPGYGTPYKFEEV